MPIEPIRDRIPQQIYNKHTSYENSVLQEHGSIVSSLKDTDSKEALLEAQGRLFIGLCLKEKANKFIETKYRQYYDDEYKKATGDNSENKKALATTRAWERLINEASAMCLNRYKIDGTEARLAVIDDELFDHLGRIVEVNALAKAGLVPPHVEFEVPEDAV